MWIDRFGSVYGPARKAWKPKPPNQNWWAIPVELAFRKKMKPVEGR